MKIFIYCGASIDDWSPKSVQKGVGGSEEMVIYLAEELAKAGDEITVWNNCGDDEGDYDGVRYKNYEEAKGECDVLVVWRTPQMLINQCKSIQAKKKYLWLHDTVGQDEVLPFIYLFDKIMVLSPFHRNLYPKIDDKHFFMTRNAIRLNYFENKSLERNPYRIVYGSSYDRGLKEVLENWSYIKSKVPEAELHIFYGWETWEKIAEQRKDKKFKFLKEYMEHLMDQEGITHLGRISHERVAEEFLQAGVWGYPSWWPETSNLTAMKAQIGGAIPVVVPSGATQDTVMFGYKTPWPNKYNPGTEVPIEVIDLWCEQIISVLRDVKTQEALRKVMMPRARVIFGFEELAKSWRKEFEL